MMRGSDLFFVLMSSVRTVRILRASLTEQSPRLAERTECAVGVPGVFRQILPAYFAYYRSDFHPRQQAESTLYAETVKRHFL